MASPLHAVPDSAIAIVGLACRFPGARSPQEFWQLLCSGRDAIEPLLSQNESPRAAFYRKAGVAMPPWHGGLDDCARFDAAFFEISPREAVYLDPQQRLLLQVAWEALEDAGVVATQLAGSRTGVFVGASSAEYAYRMAGQENLETYALMGNSMGMLANRLSYFFDWRGPSYTVDTSCSASLSAVHLACESLRRGESECAIAGGVHLSLAAEVTAAFTRGGFLAPNGRCKTFDQQADGFVRSNGLGLVVLMPYAKALAAGHRIYATLRGSAVNQDGRTNGITAPSHAAQQAVLREAMRNAGVRPQQMQYLEAHGSGSALGDKVEAMSMAGVLQEGRMPDATDPTCYVGSVKTNVGHLEGAAGVAGLIKVALAIYHRQIPPHLHVQNANASLADTPLRINTAPTPWPAGFVVAGVNSFGFGGSNAHVVLGEGAASQWPSLAARGACLLPLSARDPQALVALARAYAARLEGDAPAVLDEVAYSAALRRVHHPYRTAVVASSVSEARAHLLQVQAPALEQAPPKLNKLAFVFSGQGSQWPRMGLQLYAQEPVYRAAFDACDALMQPLLGASVLQLLQSGDEILGVAAVVPAIFTVQVALAALWESWGAKPTVVIGHSMGEVTAAYVAGALTLREAVQVTVVRARALARIAGQGHMLATDLSAAEASRVVADLQGKVSVAVVNGPRSTVLGGHAEAMHALAARLQAQGVVCQPVQMEVASHTQQVDVLQQEVLAALQDLRPAKPHLMMISTVDARATPVHVDAHYWWRNMRETVNFQAAMQQAQAAGVDGFVEISPHAVLLLPMRDQAPHALVAGSLRRERDARSCMLEALGRLYTHQHAVPWSALFAGVCRPVDLPFYPWQGQRYWLEEEAPGMAPAPHAWVPYSFELQWEALPTPLATEAWRGARVWLAGGAEKLAGALRAAGAEVTALPLTGARASQLETVRLAAAGGAVRAVFVAGDFTPVVCLAQALQDWAPRDMPRLVLLTQEAAFGDRAGREMQACVWNLARTLAHEIPALRTLALDGLDDSAQLLALAAGRGEEQVSAAHGGGVPRLHPAQRAPAPAGLRGAAIYAVLGSAAAQVQWVAAQLVAAGARQIAVLQPGLEVPNARLHTVADLAAARALGSLAGVVALPAPMAQRGFAAWEAADLAAQISARVAAMRALFAATQQDALDFRVCMAALPGWLGGHEQAGASALSAALAALCAGISGATCLFTDSLQQPPAAHVAAVLPTWLGAGRTVAMCDLNLRQWRQMHPAAADMQLLAPLRAAAPAPPGATPDAWPRALAGQDGAAQRRFVEREVTALVGQVLRLPTHRLEAQTPLAALGMDSIMAVELRNLLEGRMGKDLPAALLFAYPTLHDLAGYLLGLLAAAGQQVRGVVATSVETKTETKTETDVDSLSEAELRAALAAELDGISDTGLGGDA